MRPLLGVLLIVSCAEPGAEGPAPRQVSPSRGAAATEVAITITGEHFEPLVFADYRSGAGHVAADFQAQLEDGEGGVVPLGEVTWLASHTLTARVPASAPRGRFDLVVSDPLGRSGRLWSAFQLVSSAENVAAFTVDVAGMPTAGVPFVVRVTAVDLEGATVGGFEGSVGITGPGLAAASFGPFERGVFRGFVTAPAPAQQLTLVAEDEAGRRGESTPFDVVHGPATQVEFLGGPSAAEAGACVGPFDVERRGALGLPAPDAQEETLALDAVPAEGVTFFSDAACASPQASVSLGAGAASGRFFALATRAGTVALRVRGSSLPGRSRDVEVTPRAPVRLVLRGPSAPLRAGACSGELALETRDEFGNAAPALAPVGLELVADGAGVTLHGDVSCASALGAVALAAGEGAVRFALLAASAGPLTVSGRAVDGGLAETSARLEVLP